MAKYRTERPTQSSKKSRHPWKIPFSRRRIVAMNPEEFEGPRRRGDVSAARGARKRVGR